MEIAITSDAAMKEDSPYGKYDEYQVECAARAIKQAEEAKADPELMKYVKQYLQEEKDELDTAITSLDQLRAISKKKSAAAADTSMEYDGE